MRTRDSAWARLITPGLVRHVSGRAAKSARSRDIPPVLTNRLGINNTISEQKKGPHSPTRAWKYLPHGRS